MADDKTRAIGIDLGTTCYCLGVYQHGRVEIITNNQGNRTTPYCVPFYDSERLLGSPAKEQYARNPTNTNFDANCLIDCKFDDESVQKGIKHWPFRIMNHTGMHRVGLQLEEYQGETRTFTPEEISAMVLAKIRQTAEAYLGYKVTEAVITVPAYFTHSQKQTTKDAGARAGLTVLRILNKSTAAALAYDLGKQVSDEKNVLVFDMGGATCEVSVLTIDEGSLIEVRSTVRDIRLGGEDIDSRMVQHFIAEFRRKHKKDITSNLRAVRLLTVACERAKRTLSSCIQTNVEIDSLVEGIGFDSSITRARLEELCCDLFGSTLEAVQHALRDAKLDKSRIHEVVLVGGSARIPRIQKLLGDFFGGKELHKSINPEEAVAYGASLQAALLTGDESVGDGLGYTCYLCLTPLSLGIGTAGGVMTKFINRNTEIPVKTSKRFTVYSDNCHTVTVHVYEGERAMTKDNNLLGSFDLPATHIGGVQKIEITFDIDINEVLHVSVKDENTEKNEKTVINNYKGRLSRVDIDRMLSEAEQFREQDDIQKARIRLDSYESHGYLLLEVCSSNDVTCKSSGGPTIDEVD